MTMTRVWSLAIMLAGVAAGWSVSLPSYNTPPGLSRIPTLVNTCLITENVNQLVKFYEPILAFKAQRSGEDYAEFPTGIGVLAIFSAGRTREIHSWLDEVSSNQSAILEFRVTNVDHEYRQTSEPCENMGQAPTTQPWGTRSIYFRDPDGNLVDFYAPLKAQ